VQVSWPARYPRQVCAHAGHGGINEPASAGRAGGERREPGEHPRERIGDGIAAEHRRVSGRPGDQPAGHGGVIAEGDPLRRIVAAITSHRHPHPAWRGAQPIFCHQAELAQRPRPAALDDDACPGGEPDELGPAGRGAEVEPHGRDAVVQATVERGRPRPGPVWPATVFYLEHTPAGLMQDAGAQRPGPHRRQVEHQRECLTWPAELAEPERPGGRRPQYGSGYADQLSRGRYVGGGPERRVRGQVVPWAGAHVVAEHSRHAALVVWPGQVHRGPAVGSAQDAAGAVGRRAAEALPAVQRGPVRQQVRRVQPDRPAGTGGQLGDRADDERGPEQDRSKRRERRAARQAGQARQQPG
jgi:hypothetical protein